MSAQTWNRNDQEENAVDTAGTVRRESSINRRKFKLPSAGTGPLSWAWDIFCLIAVNFYRK
jgi:hypothetical protein